MKQQVNMKHQAGTKIGPPTKLPSVLKRMRKPDRIVKNKFIKQVLGENGEGDTTRKSINLE